MPFPLKTEAVHFYRLFGRYIMQSNYDQKSIENNKREIQFMLETKKKLTNLIQGYLVFFFLNFVHFLNFTHIRYFNNTAIKIGRR